jgi:hypothetical protein
MPSELLTATLGGSRACNIVIRGRGLSKTHLLLERRATKLRIYDQHSTNGTYVRGSRVETADLDPGDLFSPRPITLVAMDDQMRRLRPLLVDIIGSGAVRSPDWVMVQAATGSGPLLITGEAGCDMLLLARSIHAMSTRRNAEAIETSPPTRSAGIGLVKQAHKSTLILLLGKGADLDARFAEELFSPTFCVRPIVIAASGRDADVALGPTLLAATQHIPLRPLAYRQGDIPELLDRMFRAKNADGLRVADMDPHNQAALRDYNWPENFDSLRKVVDAIVAYMTCGNLRAAAKHLGTTHSSLGRFFESIGLDLRALREPRAIGS